MGEVSSDPRSADRPAALRDRGVPLDARGDGVDRLRDSAGPRSQAARRPARWPARRPARPGAAPAAAEPVAGDAAAEDAAAAEAAVGAGAAVVVREAVAA